MLIFSSYFIQIDSGGRGEAILCSGHAGYKSDWSGPPGVEKSHVWWKQSLVRQENQLEHLGTKAEFTYF